jgi:hypothetical protein
MPRQQVIDKIADNGVRFVPELRHHSTDEGATPRVPFQVNGPVNIAGAVNFRPTLRPAGLLEPDLDETKLFLQLRIAHDFVPQRTAPGCDDLDNRLHSCLLGSPVARILQSIPGQRPDGRLRRSPGRQIQPAANVDTITVQF